MILADLLALESRWPVLVALIVLGTVELLGMREMKDARARRSAARQTPRVPVFPRSPAGLSPRRERVRPDDR